MSKRNFILLIIILGLAVIAVFGFLYSRKEATAPGDGDTSANFFSRLNPFGDKTSAPGDATPKNGGSVSESESVPGQEVTLAKLKKVSSMPVAGFTVFMKERLKEILVVPQILVVPPETEVNKPATKPIPPPTEFALALRYADRATGNIYQTFADKIEERKFSETIIPKIYDAYFGKNGEFVVMRHLKINDRTIETFAGALPKEKIGEDIATNEIQGAFLVDDIKDISLSPDATKIFYLFNSGESAIGIIYNLSDAQKTQVSDSAFTEWLSFWPSAKIITLTTKPSGSVPGYMYMIDVDKKNLTKVLGEVNGLTTQMSPSGKLVLYSDNTLLLSLYHPDTKTSEGLGVRTLSEKCVWNKTNEFVYCAVPVFTAGATYPDDWYKGEVLFSDQIWKINVQNGNATIIADPVEVSGEDIDGIKLALSPNEDYLFFINKKDSFLWELELR